MLFILAAVVATIARTVTQEEVFREWKDYCVNRSKSCNDLARKKFFYLFTCQYCFSHWVTALVLFITGFKLAYTDWRGTAVALFTIVAVANLFMAVYERLTVSTKEARARITSIERESFYGQKRHVA